MTEIDSPPYTCIHLYIGTNEQFVAVVFITSTPFAKQHFFFILSFFDTTPTTQAAAFVFNVIILYNMYTNRRTGDVRDNIRLSVSTGQKRVLYPPGQHDTI